MYICMILYYTILYPSRPGRPPGPAWRPPSSGVQRGLGGGHAPQRGLRGAAPPSSILVLGMFRMQIGKPGCYILSILVGATACHMHESRVPRLIPSLGGLRPLLPRQAFCVHRMLAFGVTMRSVYTECSLWRVTGSRGEARLEVRRLGQRRRG